MNIGIMGMGVVGGATSVVFQKKHTIYPYDKYKSEFNSSENLENLVREAEVVFVCVPTPMKKSGGIDYSPIYTSMEALKTYQAARIHEEKLLVTIRSTAVSGTTDTLAAAYPMFSFAFNPEFLTEKNAAQDMEHTSRVVIGVSNKKDEQTLMDVYTPLFPNASYTIVDRKSAEMIKYAANVLLAGQIALANEIYQICQHTGVDYECVKDTVLQDERIGRNIHVPGHDGNLGFGGKCFPKDLNALIHVAREHGYRPHLLEEVWRLNERVRPTKDWLDILGATSEKNFKEVVA